MDRALQPIDELLDAGQNDPELKVMRAKCLFATQRAGEAANYCNKLIGYDPKTDKFDAAKAEAADQPEAYSLLAQYLYNNQKTRAGGTGRRSDDRRQSEIARRVRLPVPASKADGQARQRRASFETAYQDSIRRMSPCCCSRAWRSCRTIRRRCPRRPPRICRKFAREAEKHLDDGGQVLSRGTPTARRPDGVLRVRRPRRAGPRSHGRRAGDHRRRAQEI